MARQLLPLVVLLVFCRASQAGETVAVSRIGDRIELVQFTSRAFEATKEYCVVLPAGYDKGKREWPVLYLLHGRGRNSRSLIDLESSRATLLDAPFVTVLPNGEDGWYVDSPVDRKSRFESLLSEIIDHADARYHTSSNRQHRAIAGWSMGGYGAAHYAVMHPNQFGTLATILGLLDFPRSGLPAGQGYDVPTRVFDNRETEWAKFNPLSKANELRNSNVILITADQAFDRTMNEHFHDRLQQLKIDHEWVVLRGTHHLDVVKQALPIVLKHVQREFARSAARDSSKHAN